MKCVNQPLVAGGFFWILTVVAVVVVVVVVAVVAVVAVVGSVFVEMLGRSVFV